MKIITSLPHVIVRRSTSDEKPVCVWSDGDLTSAMGYSFRGVRVQKNVSLSLLISEEACLFDAKEMPSLIRAANRLAKKGAVEPGALRALASKLAKKVA